jgi:hypothetical protein
MADAAGASPSCRRRDLGCRLRALGVASPLEGGALMRPSPEEDEMPMSTPTTSPFEEFDAFDDFDATAPTMVVGHPIDIERLSAELGELADGHICATCRDDPGHRFELLRTLGARLQPEARDRLELIALAGHLAWTDRRAGQSSR